MHNRPMNPKEVFKKYINENIITDSFGNEIAKGDECFFWTNPLQRVRYRFHAIYQRDVDRPYISVDVDDNDDLSWWAYCEKVAP